MGMSMGNVHRMSGNISTPLRICCASCDHGLCSSTTLKLQQQRKTLNVDVVGQFILQNPMLADGLRSHVKAAAHQQLG